VRERDRDERGARREFFFYVYNIDLDRYSGACCEAFL
jgi:hypothetical protein